MKNNHQLSKLIYDFFLMRFHFQYYKYGDTLPSIETLCREFSVSPQTVKSALRRLREEGFIDMHNGRSTKVIYRQTEQELWEKIQQYLSARQWEFADLFKTADMIFTPMIIEGFRRISSGELEELAHYVQGGRVDYVLKFFGYVLQKLENPLTMNLYWETSMFFGLSFVGEKIIPNLRDPVEVYEALRNIISTSREQDWDHLNDAIVDYQRSSEQKALERIAADLPVRRDQEQIPFIWRIYYDRPQICYSLSMRLLHEIYLGEYRGKRFLPSYEKMAGKYNVSVSTMRRTIRVITQMGAVEPVNGVGIRILSVGETERMPDFSSPAVRSNVALFFQAFELVIYTSERVVPVVLKGSEPEELDSLIRQLEENRHTGRCEFSLWHLLIYIAQYSPLRGVREIYEKIYGLFLWGYPLKISHKKTLRNDQEDERFTENMLRLLREEDFQKAEACFRGLVTRQFAVAERYLLKCGMQPDELRISTSIRLMLD